MMDIYKMQDCNFYGKRVLLRVDFSLTLKSDGVYDLTRILRILPTIQYLIKGRAKLVIISHFGRPKAKNKKFSLKNIARIVSKIINRKIEFIEDCVGEKVQKAINIMKKGDILFLENLRFYEEEEKNDLNFAKQLALLADIYINDAFSCSHRKHASISGITKFLPSYSGFCLQNELEYLKKAISFNDKPITVIVGGSKILTKIKMLRRLVEKIDYLILGGAIANNFLLLKGINIGKSLFQDGIESLLYEIIEIANKSNCKIITPQDALVAADQDYNIGIIKNIQSILDSDTILDIGPKTLSLVSNILTKSKTLIWSGPIGVFERPVFASGTIKILRMVSHLTHDRILSSVVGGGDSLSAIKVAGLTDKDFTYVSTGGSAFLSWLGNETMPGIVALQPKLVS